MRSVLALSLIALSACASIESVRKLQYTASVGCAWACVSATYMKERGHMTECQLENCVAVCENRELKICAPVVVEIE